MSGRTTNFGPRVSFTTTLADAGPVHVYGDSNSTLEWAGTVLLSGGITPSGPITSSSTNTFSGHNAFTGTVNAPSGSTVTLAGAVGVSGPIISSSTNTFSGANAFSGNINEPSGSTHSHLGYNVFSGNLNVVSGSTATFAGRLASSSTISQTLSSVFLSKTTTASYTSLTLADGEFTIGAVSVSSCVLYYRSGVTTYRFIADTGAII